MLVILGDEGMAIAIGLMLEEEHPLGQLRLYSSTVNLASAKGICDNSFSLATRPTSRNRFVILYETIITQPISASAVRCKASDCS